MKGPYTIRRDKLAAKYRWKAENIVRFFDKLGMTKKQKIEFLSEELAGIHMQAEEPSCCQGWGQHDITCMYYGKPKGYEVNPHLQNDFTRAYLSKGKC